MVTLRIVQPFLSQFSWHCASPRIRWSNRSTNWVSWYCISNYWAFNSITDQITWAGAKPAVIDPVCQVAWRHQISCVTLQWTLNYVWSQRLALLSLPRHNDNDPELETHLTSSNFTLEETNLEVLYRNVSISEVISVPQKSSESWVEWEKFYSWEKVSGKHNEKNFNCV